jgi:hypothetical protein
MNDLSRRLEVVRAMSATTTSALSFFNFDNVLSRHYIIYLDLSYKVNE